MTSPYHHGDLRTTLLDEAERIVIAEGVDAISLRELARRAGVSHAAPRHHFADRQALVQALAERGFEQLYAQVQDVMGETSRPRPERLRAAASAFVMFARQRAHIVELMFATIRDDATGTLAALAMRQFELVGELIVDRPAVEDSETRRLAFVAMLQGIATLSATDRITERQVDALVAYSVTLFDDQ